MILWQALVVFVILFAVILVLGLLSYRFLGGGEESAEDEMSEWGLGGRRFGTIITWFLVGGDLYTAYTLIAVPGLVFGLGAIGFFALPYTIIVYPLVLLIMPKLWQIAHNRGMVTPADYVKERFDSSFLALLIAITGFAATMPYIALQMYGIEIVVAVMGIPVTASLIVAFAIVALFTFVSGLRAPALIALVKDTLIILTIIVAVVYIAYQLGGFDNIFAQVPQARQTLAPEQYARFWLGAGAVPLPTRHNGHLRFEQPEGDPAQRFAASGLHDHPRLGRPLWLHGARRGYPAHGPRGGRRGTPAVRRLLCRPASRRCLRGHRHRRRGSRLGDGHRRVQPLYPQLLSGVHPSGHLLRRRGHGLKDRLDDSACRGPHLGPLRAQLRHHLAAGRRGVDPADAAGRVLGPVHRVARPVGARGGVARRDSVGDIRDDPGGIRKRGAGPSCALRLLDAALRRVLRAGREPADRVRRQCRGTVLLGARAEIERDAH